MEVKSVNHWTTSEVPCFFLFFYFEAAEYIFESFKIGYTSKPDSQLSALIAKVFVHLHVNKLPSVFDELEVPICGTLHVICVCAQLLSRVRPFAAP